MQEYIDAYPESSDTMRLRLANVFIKGPRDGRSALRVLKEVDQESLSDEARATFKKLAEAANERR